jgi:hypothetical protein
MTNTGAIHVDSFSSVFFNITLEKILREIHMITIKTTSFTLPSVIKLYLYLLFVSPLHVSVF